MADSRTPYGFEWGPMKVERCTEYRGSRVVLITTDTHTLEVCVSPKGNSIRAWLDHAPMTPEMDVKK